MMDKWDQSYANGEGLRWWPETELVRFLGKTYCATTEDDRSRGNALDLGCGTGRNAWLLNEVGFEVNAIDQSEAAITIARQYIICQRRRSGIYFDVAGWPNKLFRDNCFELVVDCQTIQHLTDGERPMAYQEIARVLKPEGHFWTMHFKGGDAEPIYGGMYPELAPRTFEQFCEPIISAGLTEVNTELVMRTYSKAQQRIFWYVSEWVKP